MIAAVCHDAWTNSDNKEGKVAMKAVIAPVNGALLELFAPNRRDRGRGAAER